MEGRCCDFGKEVSAQRWVVSSPMFTKARSGCWLLFPSELSGSCTVVWGPVAASGHERTPSPREQFHWGWWYSIPRWFCGS